MRYACDLMYGCSILSHFLFKQSHYNTLIKKALASDNLYLNSSSPYIGTSEFTHLYSRYISTYIMRANKVIHVRCSIGRVCACPCSVMSDTLRPWTYSPSGSSLMELSEAVNAGVG